MHTGSGSPTLGGMPHATLRRILLVEDDPGIRAVVCTALELLGGWAVHACATPADALAAIDRAAPDLLITDVMMGATDGPTLVRQLRSDPARPHLPVVFITATVDPALLAQVAATAPLGVISKPFDPLQLAERVRGLWDRQSAMPAAPGRRSA